MNQVISGEKDGAPFGCKKEYAALLLIHVAHADLEYSPEERCKILDIVSESQLQKLESFYNSHSDYQILDLLIQYRQKYFPGEVNRNELIDAIREIFGADGEISSLENSLLRFLEHLI